MSPVATIDPALIKRLREQTGAGVMDCRRALETSQGEFDGALRWLKAQGAAIAAKKADRATKAGAIAAYVHGGRIGVLVEVNSETDFVARNERFQEFVHQLGLHIAAMNPAYVSPDDVPSELVADELGQLQESLEGAEGDAFVSAQKAHMEQFYARLCLLNQPFVKDESKTIQDLLTELIAVTGENIVVRRFIRYQLGASASPTS
ncbi:MAG: translation elongation factor Ts [Candidatus Omnitrophica bacterium]|nr:translation elongation factor Ts [Candidatus Omnitrophota bacterium]